MPISPEDLGKLIPKETVDRIYGDAISGSAKELGKLGSDSMKTLRLLLAPLQITGALQDRLEGMVERMRKRVPEERRLEVLPEVAGPALEKMRYLQDRSDLWKMFEEILTKAMDRDEVTRVHPSFTHIISQLSRDEAWILYRLRERSFNVVDTMDLKGDRFENRVIEKSELPTAELYLPGQIELYHAHLESLSLVTWPITKQDPIKDSAGKQTGVRRWSTMQLTDFGRLFAAACIPPEGFEPLKATG